MTMEDVYMTREILGALLELVPTDEEVQLIRDAQKKVCSTERRGKEAK